jgi:hypothetical protein
MLDVPILFLVYNRPELTKIIFDEICKIKPKKLFISADGPKEGILGDMEKCLSVRRIINVKNINWDCEYHILFQPKNLGGKWGGYTGINWFFNFVNEGIILEDDDLPNISFFKFCEILLEKYRDNEKIGMISGDNFQFGNNKTNDSYYFSKYLHGWGWATWKRTWDLFDITIKDWPETKGKLWIGDFLDSPHEYGFWDATLDRMYAGATDAWDYQFCYSLWKNKMFNIIPNINLVTNIGNEGTHSNNPMINQKREEMKFPLKHPEKIERFKKADIYTLRYYI